MIKAVALHLACGLAGWGIVTALFPAAAPTAGVPASGKAAAPAKSTSSPAAHRESSAILQRLRQGLVVHEPTEASAPPFSSLDRRLEQLLRRKDIASLDPAAARERALCEILIDDLKALLHGGRRPDLTSAFRRGEKDASDLLREVTTLLPDPAAAPALRQALYTVLAPLDPLRAEALLDPIPDDKLHRLRYAQLSADSLHLSPDAFLSVLRTLPEPADPATRRARIIAWEARTRAWASTCRDDYHHWVESLPPGLDRDLALAPLVGHLKKQRPDEADRLRQLIADPEIQARY